MCIESVRDVRRNGKKGTELGGLGGRVSMSVQVCVHAALRISRVERFVFHDTDMLV